jgi:hypothetical protein
MPFGFIAPKTLNYLNYYIKREMYQEFTKKGSIIDYCVWPVLYLEKDGPLGTKGIVQVY